MGGRGASSGGAGKGGGSNSKGGFTTATTDALVAMQKNIIENRLAWLNGKLPMTSEQVAEMDTRGYAIAAELESRLGDKEYHDPQYPRIRRG